MKEIHIAEHRQSLTHVVLLYQACTLVQEKEVILLTNHILFHGVSIGWQFHWLISDHVYQHGVTSKVDQLSRDVGELNMRGYE